MDAPKNSLLNTDQKSIWDNLFSTEQMKKCVWFAIKQNIDLQITELSKLVFDYREKREKRKLEQNNHLKENIQNKNFSNGIIEFNEEMQLLIGKIEKINLMVFASQSDIKEILTQNEELIEELYNLNEKIKKISELKLSFEKKESENLEILKKQIRVLLEKRELETNKIITNKRAELLEKARQKYGFEKNKINHYHLLSSFFSKIDEWCDLLFTVKNNLNDLAKKKTEEIEPISIEISNNGIVVSDSEEEIKPFPENKKLLEIDWEKPKKVVFQLEQDTYSDTQNFLVRQKELIKDFSSWSKDKRTDHVSQFMQNFLAFKNEIDQSLKGSYDKIKSLSQKIDAHKAHNASKLLDKQNLEVVLESTKKYIPTCLIEGPIKNWNEKGSSLSKDYINLRNLFGKTIIRMDFMHAHFKCLEIVNNIEPIYKFRSYVKELNSNVSSLLAMFDGICIESLTSLVPKTKKSDILKGVAEKLLATHFYLKESSNISKIKIDIDGALKTLPSNQVTLAKALKKIQSTLLNFGNLSEVKSNIDEVLRILQASDSQSIVDTLDQPKKEVRTYQEVLTNTRQTIQSLLHKVTTIELTAPKLLTNQEGIAGALKQVQSIILTSQFSQLKDKLAELKQTRAKLRFSMIEQLKKISDAEVSIEKNYAQYSKAFSDESKPWFIDFFTKQKNKFKIDLNTQKINFVKKWNQTCFVLEKLICDFHTLEKSINLEFNMGLCYLDAKEIIVCLRNTRLNEPKRDVHLQKWQGYRDSFNRIAKYIDEQTSDKLLYNPKDEDFWTALGEHNLNSLHAATLKVLNNKHTTLKGFLTKNDLKKEMEDIGLIWLHINNEENKHLPGNDLTNSLKKYWEKQCEGIDDRTKNMKAGLKQLIDDYPKAALELNLVGNTLHDTVGYDSNFNEGYYSKDPFKSSVQYMGTAVVNLGSSALASVWPSSNPDTEDLQIVMNPTVTVFQPVYPPKFII